MLLAVKYMSDSDITAREANKAIEQLFTKIEPLRKKSKAILVKVDNCTIYIPVTNLDESRVHEFKERFDVLYGKTKENI